jgi:hypothetical protein
MKPLLQDSASSFALARDKESEEIVRTSLSRVFIQPVNNKKIIATICFMSTTKNYSMMKICDKNHVCIPIKIGTLYHGKRFEKTLGKCL